MANGNQRLWIILIVAGCLVVLSAAPTPLIDNDGPLYGKIAKNILATGDWLTLHHRDGQVFDKPPLTMWLIALSFRVGGISYPTIRLWQLLMHVLLVYVTYLIARLSAGREQALLAALIMVTGFQVFFHALTPQQDIPLTLFLALAFYAYLRYRTTGAAAHAVLAGLWVALAVLTKGVVGLGIFGVIAGPDVLMSRRRSGEHWHWGHVAAGATIFMAVAAPWFVVGAIRQGTPFIDTFFLKGNSGVGRLFSPRISALPPLWVIPISYVPSLIVGMLPWTGLLPGAIREGWRNIRTGPAPLRLCGLWAGLYFLFVTFAATDKLYRYLLPVYPPLAVLAAPVLLRALDEPRRLRVAAMTALLIGVPLMIAGAWWIAVQFPEDVRLLVPVGLPVITVCGLAVAAFAAAAIGGRARMAVALVSVGVLTAYAVCEWTLARYWDGIWPWPRVGATIDRLYRPGDRVVIYKYPDAFLAYFAEARVEEVNEPIVLARLWRQGRVFVVLGPGTQTDVPHTPRAIVLDSVPRGLILITNLAAP